MGRRIAAAAPEARLAAAGRALESPAFVEHRALELRQQRPEGLAQQPVRMAEILHFGIDRRCGAQPVRFDTATRRSANALGVAASRTEALVRSHQALLCNDTEQGAEIAREFRLAVERARSQLQSSLIYWLYLAHWESSPQALETLVAAVEEGDLAWLHARVAVALAEALSSAEVEFDELLEPEVAARCRAR